MATRARSTRTKKQEKEEEKTKEEEKVAEDKKPEEIKEEEPLKQSFVKLQKTIHEVRGTCIYPVTT